MYRVIAADDEPMMRKGLQALVDWEGMNCTLAAVFEDGQSLLDELDSLSPDIVICDIKMPRKDGIAVAKEIFMRHLPIKVILLTAYADFSYAQMAIQYGVCDYVTKTGAVDGILEAVKKCKAQLEQETTATQQVREEDVELYFKAVLDGSIYNDEQIRAQALLLGLHLEQFVFCVAEIFSNEARSAQLIDKSHALLQTLGGTSGCYLLPVSRSRSYIVLCGAPPADLNLRCRELTDTFFSLTGHNIYLGISALQRGASALRVGAEQAREALDERFFRGNIAVHIWNTSMAKPAGEDRAARVIPRICAAVESGNVKDTDAQLEDFLCILAEGTPSSARENSAALLNSLNAVPTEGKGDIPNAQEALDCVFFADVQKLLRTTAVTAAEQCAEYLRSGSGLIAEVQRYISKNYLHPITLGEVAAAVNVNPSYLSRTFKSKTGQGIVEFITHKKMEKAKELLNLGQLKIYEISFAVGIDDTAYFSLLFRKHTGLSPKSYQEKNGCGKPNIGADTTRH